MTLFSAKPSASKVGTWKTSARPASPSILNGVAARPDPVRLMVYPNPALPETIPVQEKQGSVMERIRHPQIVPLELSDLWVDGATLWQWSQGHGFSSALRNALDMLRAGS